MNKIEKSNAKTEDLPTTKVELNNKEVTSVEGSTRRGFLQVFGLMLAGCSFDPSGLRINKKDAEIDDAGMDATTPDANLPDASAVDASLSDAGLPDASQNPDAAIDAAIDSGVDAGPPQEDCTTNIDEDGNGLAGCADKANCDLFDNGEIKCAYGEAHEINCTDGIDNDGNGDTDCNDVACSITADCGANVENCSNDISDNGNPWTDCLDSTCSLDDVCIQNSTYDCGALPEGAACPTGLAPGCHQGLCGEDVGIGRVCQPPKQCYQFEY